MKEKKRCHWVPQDKPDYIAYHDDEWGRPVHEDQKLFEMLILEGAQAGLSWYTILKKRDAYRRAFKRFDPASVAAMKDGELQKLLVTESGIVRNRLKVAATHGNAKVFLDIQKEFGSFDKYLWKYINGKPLEGGHRKKKARAVASLLSRDLKARGMRFVGEEIVYSFMQAVGLVNDHDAQCYVRKRIRA